MIQRARQVLSSTLARAGYRVAKVQPREMPVEFDAGDRDVVAHVLGRELSMTSHERLYSTLLACKHVVSTGVQGDFVECGVWRGGNSLIAADVFARLDPTRLVHLFDTFAGMTEPTAQDVPRTGTANAHDTYVQLRKGDTTDWCYASLDEVQNNFRARGLYAGARFVKGDVSLTLRDEGVLPAKISVLRLDTDWYESTKLELEVLYPRLQRGGVLIVDDYGYWGGAKQAVDEYFSREPRPLLQYIDHTGRLAVKP